MAKKKDNDQSMKQLHSLELYARTLQTNLEKGYKISGEAKTKICDALILIEEVFMAEG